MRKVLQLTGFIEVVLAVLLSIFMKKIVSSDDSVIAILSNGGNVKIALFVSLGIFPAIVLLGGILGIIGRGRHVLQMFGILVIVSAVQNGALMLILGSGLLEKVYLVLLIICIVDAFIYFISACIHRRLPKPGRPGEEPHPPAAPEE